MLKITSKMNGKMQGMVSINTTPRSNDFCLNMAKTDSVCGSCYSHRMMKMYKNADKAFKHNGDVLSGKLLSNDEVPKLNHHTVRFNAHGELINDTHMINLLRICNGNPRTTFTLWTKRKDIVHRVLSHWKRPSNLILIYSSPKINKRSTLPEHFDKVFTVYDKEHKGKRMINCGEKKCVNCMTCYDTADRKRYINEVVK